MNFEIVPSHVAILVPSVEKAAAFLKQFKFKIGPAEIWEGEGTKEIYVESGKANSLLLMEPIRAGAYQRALEKRGPGLHHLAIDVLNVEGFIEGLSGSGWLLQPSSLKTFQQFKTVYLARPGFPALIEVQQKEKLDHGKLFVENLRMPLEENHIKMIKALSLDKVIQVQNKSTELILGGHSIRIEDLF